MALIVESAGGVASTGMFNGKIQRMLDVSSSTTSSTALAPSPCTPTCLSVIVPSLSCMHAACADFHSRALPRDSWIRA